MSICNIFSYFSITLYIVASIRTASLGFHNVQFNPVALKRPKLCAILAFLSAIGLMDGYKEKNLTHHPLLFILTSDKLCVCEYTENQVLADLYFRAFYITHQYG